MRGLMCMLAVIGLVNGCDRLATALDPDEWDCRSGGGNGSNHSGVNREASPHRHGAPTEREAIYRTLGG